MPGKKKKKNQSILYSLRRIKIRKIDTMGRRKGPIRQPVAMAALIAAVPLAGLPFFSAEISSSSSTFSRSPRAWPWQDQSPPIVPFAASTNSNSNDRGRATSSILFRVNGNVYPDGFYSVSIKIGDPPKSYLFDVDTGSDLTWLQCELPNHPCFSCSQGRHRLYQPPKSRLVPCEDPLCTALHESTNHEGECEIAEECDYKMEYMDHGSSIGVLVSDAVTFHLTNSSLAHPVLAIGCGYEQKAGPNGQLATDGVLGLGRGTVSIVSQLSELGICRRVFGHCLGRQDGFLFLGEDVVPPRMMTWAPMDLNAAHKYYSSGLAEVYVGKQQLGVQQAVVFDSGSTYTYFNDQLYQHLLSAVSIDISNSKMLPKEPPNNSLLRHCWKSTKPFKSVLDLKKYFRPLILSFGNGKAPAQMEIPPENYFIITRQGNACLGILNGTEVGLGDLNVIGDISMQDVVVVYDNESHRIGWARVAGCNKIPRFVNDAPP